MLVGGILYVGASVIHDHEIIFNGILSMHRLNAINMVMFDHVDPRMDDDHL